ncbi:MAG TPA: hypothetical protein VGL72_12505 [Bryobacteraceae bacterium]
MGISYVEGYYSKFGLSLRDLSFDMNEVMVLTRRAFPSWFWSALFAASAFWIIGTRLLKAALVHTLGWKGRSRRFTAMVRIAEVLLGARPSRKTGDSLDADAFLERAVRSQWPFSVILFGLGILALISLSENSIGRGETDAAAILLESKTTLPQAEFQIKHESELLEGGSILHGHLLVHGRTGYYLIPRLLESDSLRHNIPTGNIEVNFIPEDEVAAIRIIAPQKVEDKDKGK